MNLLSREDYLFGNCNVFALAAKEILKLNIVCLLEDRLITTSGVMRVKESLIHCYLKVSETEGFDARGIRPTKEILDEYQFDCTELPSWLSENKTTQEVIGYGYQQTGSNVVIDIANARQWIHENLSEDIQDVLLRSKNCSTNT